MGRSAPLGLGLAAAVILVPSSAAAAIIHVTPADSYAKIEAANPGDEVVIAPGTYAFRVYLTKTASATSPILIHAEDPANPPVWDLGTTLVEDAPGSYGAGDRGRGCWQISGGTGYVIEDIVFTHCRNAQADSAGIRYYEGASVIIRDCIFRDNDNGLTGGTQDSTATVEYCEFDHNGNGAAPSSAPTHNMYIYGGVFTLRYSWAHDALQGQNFHVRARQATLEYNWFARAASYAGDLMTSDDYAGGSTYAQSMVLRGNVFLQGTTQANTGQIFVLYNDTQASGLTLSAHVLYNTLVGAGAHAAFVHLSNADGTLMTAEVDDNVVSGTNAPVLVEDPTHGTVTGTHNWMMSGVGTGPLTGTVYGASAGFVDPASENFHLAPGSPCIGAASSSGLSDLPTAEYWQDEKVTRMFRARATVNDIGAFESTTTGPPQGPGADGGGGPGGDAGGVDAADGGDATVPGADAAATSGDDGGANGASPGGSSGCGCEVPAGAAPHGGAVGVAASLLLGMVRRRRRPVG
ncbi:MAG TPA: MYXO-CTERM sorting domain-containing protein [Polyangiaceae bacterium]